MLLPWLDGWPEATKRRDLSTAQPRQYPCPSLGVSDALARRELPLSLVNVSEKLELFDQFLVRNHVHENRCTPAVLGQEHWTLPALNLPQYPGNVCTELGE